MNNIDEKRPSPEAMLKLARTEETRKGKLKIFLGYAAGVGKTFSMLTVAQQLKKEGLPIPPRPAGAPAAPAVPVAEIEPDGAHKFGTVGVVALDRAGNLAAGTSTGGTEAKRWGRDDALRATLAGA